MARTQGDLDRDLRDFEANAPGPPPDDPFANAGNFPAALDRNPLFQPPPSAAVSAPPSSDADEPAAPATAAPPPDDDDGESPSDRRLRELEERISAREREIELLRAGAHHAPPPPVAQAPADPVQLIDQYLNGFAVSPQDVQTILSDPVTGAQYLQNGIRAAVAAGAALAMSQARSEFSAAQQQQQQATQLAQAFYGRNPDLQPYAKLVVQTAAEVRQANPTIYADALIEQTSRRVREQLAEWGVPIGRAAAGAAPSPRRRAAPRGEMGGNRSVGPRATSALEKQLRDFEAGVSAGRA